jgi:hypothetical protein
MEDCHCWGSTVVGEPWAVDESEYPEALRGEVTSALDESVEEEHDLLVLRREFDQHVRWFRRLVLGSDVFEVVRHGGRAGIGLQLKRAVGLGDLRRSLVGFAFPVHQTYFQALRELGYTSLLQDQGKGYVVFGPVALCQDGGVLRFGSVYKHGFSWRRSAEIHEVSRLGETVRDVRELEVFVIRVKDLRTAAQAASVQATLGVGKEVLVRYY